MTVKDYQIVIGILTAVGAAITAIVGVLFFAATTLTNVDHEQAKTAALFTTGIGWGLISNRIVRVIATERRARKDGTEFFALYSN